MKNFKPVNLFHSIKDKIKNEIKFTFFSKILPISLFSYGVLYIYKYKLYSFNECCYELSEEKQISKKLYPIIKYKFIENYYDEDNEDVVLLKSIYENLIKIFKLNLKSEVFLVKSDLIFVDILSTGSLFISDNLLNIIKEKENFRELICYFLIHSLLHVRNRHSTKNITKIYSKKDLLDQYSELIGNGIGFEHYFLNYYIYLPFSQTQEEFTIFESVKYLVDLGLIDAKKKENLDKYNLFFQELKETINFIKIYSVSDVKIIKKILKNNSYNKIDEYKRNELNLIMKNLDKFIGKKTYDKNDSNNIFEYEKNLKEDDQEIINLNKITKKIIYGDYISKNEPVEVFLHQRTMKKVKYKKRDYAEIHLIDLSKIDLIREKLLELYSNKNEFDINFTFDISRSNKESLKKYINIVKTNT